MTIVRLGRRGSLAKPTGFRRKLRAPDPTWGEIPVAFVARRDDTLDAAALTALCRDHLAGFKQPKQIHFIPEAQFPRSASGKIQRHELEARLK